METFHYYPVVDFRTPKGAVEQRRIAFSGVKQVDGTVKIGIAICNPKDMFNKKLARRISEGRAQVKPIHVIRIETDKPGHEFVQECIKLTETLV